MQGFEVHVGRTRGGGRRVDALVLHRMASFDGTRSRVTITSDDRTSSGTIVSEKTSGKNELFATIAERAYGLRQQTADAGSKYLSIRQNVPTFLQAPDRNKAEVVVQMLTQLDMNCDQALDEEFTRVVDINLRDDHPSNGKAVRCRMQASGRPMVDIICAAHKKKKVCDDGLGELDGIDTKLIRLALTVKGDVHPKLLREIRRLMAEWLAVVKGGVSTIEATEHREGIYKLFASGTTKSDKWQCAVLRGLFNDDIRIQGTIIHNCTGCCADYDHTLELCQTIGVRALLPRRIPVLTRDNWDGQAKPMDSVGLPASVHGVFVAAFLRTLAPQKPLDDASAAAIRGQLGNTGGDGDGGARTPAEARETISVWREDEDSRARGARSWVLSGTLADDIIIGRCGLNPAFKMLMQQLKLTGSAWEIKQQKIFLETGQRSYCIWEAYENNDGTEFLESITATRMADLGCCCRMRLELRRPSWCYFNS